MPARMAYISIIDNERYVLESESNRLNLTLIPPRRGWIVDRRGKALANNRVSLRIDLIPDRVRDKTKIVADLQQLLGLDADTVQRIRRDLDKSAGYQPVAVAENLDEARFASVLVRLTDLPGVAPARGFARNYPAGAAEKTGWKNISNPFCAGNRAPSASKSRLAARLSVNSTPSPIRRAKRCTSPSTATCRIMPRDGWAANREPPSSSIA
jgi:Penicillin-binding Protein dimerisation domain